ncbi:hypothetical protein [Flavobacterium sp. 9AF]|uniref:hypothetical protein n=1 Tax=Flavobacterium sp. 9AF TaxID=2653142 RepID=UPI001F164BC7|nr:hypothetical protein [Flavobacterium sp. 9AF]
MFTTVIFSVVLYNILKKLTSLGNNKNSYNQGLGNNVLLESSVYNTLEQKYRDLAKEYIKNKEYKKAAHVYMKLLKDNYTAANVLYEGGLYIEVATIHLKYLKDEKKAAECFEKGNAYTDALKLYEKHNNFEKVGDMYVCLNNREEAKKWFYKTVNQEIASGQYVKAALLIRNKIKNVTEAQQLLLDGWEKGIQREDCLSNYFHFIQNQNSIDEEIKTIYDTKTNDNNKRIFLQVIKKQFGKNEQLDKNIRTISYEIVAEYIDKNPEIVSELNYLNAQNTTFTKDALRFKLNKRRN